MKCVSIILLFSTTILIAQKEDCDPPSGLDISHGNSWLESKRTDFSYNCMLHAIEKAQNESYEIAVVDGKTYGSMEAFTKMECKGFKGCWKSMTYERYKPLKLEGTDELIIYSRPIVVQSSGKLITLTFYSIPLDTTWVMYDDMKIQKYLFSEFDKYDKDITLSLSKHSEEGVVYYKLVGTINPVARPVEPSAVGEMISYFATFIGHGLVDKIAETELDELKNIRKTKRSYYQRGAMEAILEVYDFGVKNSKIKEGEWNFSRNEGKKWCYIYNDGLTLTLFINIKADNKIVSKVVPKIEEWVKKNPFKNGVSTKVVNSGGYYWVASECTLSDKTGKEIFEDYKEGFFNDYCDDVVDEVDEVVSDLE